MKKILAFLLAISLIFTFYGCSKDSGTAGGSSTFEKPTDYASVILITINPQLRLYLDKSGNVLAVEPVNDDAKEVCEKLTLTKGEFKTVIDEIITVSNSSGYIKENATINFEIAEVKDDSLDTKQLLNTAEQTTSSSLERLEIKAEIKVSVAENTASQSSSSQESSIESSSSESNSSAEETLHTHSFGGATCTSPQICSCGATKGSALGHKYVNGVCTVCKAVKPAEYTVVGAKKGVWTCTYISGENLYIATLTLYTEATERKASSKIGDPFSKFDEEMQNDIRTHGGSEYVKYNNKEFYVAKGDWGRLVAISQTGTKTVKIKDESGNEITFTRTAENTLKVTASDAHFNGLGKVPTGTVFTFSIS